MGKTLAISIVGLLTIPQGDEHGDEQEEIEEDSRLFKNYKNTFQD